MRRDILHLMELTGAAAVGQQVSVATAGQVIDALRKEHPDFPPRVFEIAQEVSADFLADSFNGPDGMLEQLVAVYARHLSHDEILALTEFYESPVGQRVISELPQIVNESMAVGTAWEKRMEPALEAAVVARLKEEGFLPEGP